MNKNALIAALLASTATLGAGMGVMGGIVGMYVVRARHLELRIEKFERPQTSFYQVVVGAQYDMLKLIREKDPARRATLRGQIERACNSAREVHSTLDYQDAHNKFTIANKEGLLYPVQQLEQQLKQEP